MDDGAKSESSLLLIVEARQTLPLSSLIASRHSTMADEKPTLPKGWSKHISASRNIPYYRCEATGHCQWEFPSAADVANPQLAARRAQANAKAQQMKEMESTVGAMAKLTLGGAEMMVRTQMDGGIDHRRGLRLSSHSMPHSSLVLLNSFQSVLRKRPIACHFPSTVAAHRRRKRTKSSNS